MRYRILDIAPAAALVLAITACSAPLNTVTDVSDDATPSTAHRTEQSNLLLHPTSDVEGLLGRPVQQNEDGIWTVGAKRLPDCRVIRVKRSDAEFEVNRVVDLSSMTALGGGFADVVRAQVHYGGVDKVEIAIKNSAVVNAETNGKCGAQFIDTVYVGSGRRKFRRSRDAGAAVGVKVQGVGAELDHQESGELGDTLSWNTKQAYGFTCAKSDGAAKRPNLSVRVAIPSIVRNGEALSLRFEANRDAWLVVYYLEESGAGVVLWPSAEEPEPKVTTDKPAILPSPAEKDAGIKLVAQTAEPNKATRETLVVYAFASHDDFERLKPVAGVSEPDGAKLAASLADQVEKIPLSEWARAMTSYTVQP